MDSSTGLPSLLIKKISFSIHTNWPKIKCIKYETPNILSGDKKAYLFPILRNSINNIILIIKNKFTKVNCENTLVDV